MFTIPAVLGAQEEIYAPFVSQLEAAVDDNRIVLSWNDSPDEIEMYSLYRSPKAFDAEQNRDQVMIGRVEAGVESFSYYPDSTDPFYYAVLAQNSEGEEYSLFIPFRNITDLPYAVESVAGLKERAAKISDISTRTSGELVYISYQSSKPERPVEAFRSSSPIDSPEALRAANKIGSFSSSPGRLTDFPLPGLDYYYAVVDRELLQADMPDIQPGKNSTTIAASPALSSTSRFDEESRSPRIRPLPFLQLPRSIESGVLLSDVKKYALPDFTPLQPETLASVKALVENIGHGTQPLPVHSETFSVDRSPGRDPEALLLSTIILGSFSDSSWNDAKKELGNFLAVRRDTEIEARAHHYMGQVFFFQKEYRKAFYEFLSAREHLPKASDRWIDRVLAARRS